MHERQHREAAMTANNYLTDAPSTSHEAAAANAFTNLRLASYSSAEPPPEPLPVASPKKIDAATLTKKVDELLGGPTVFMGSDGLIKMEVRPFFDMRGYIFGWPLWPLWVTPTQFARLNDWYDLVESGEKKGTEGELLRAVNDFILIPDALDYLMTFIFAMRNVLTPMLALIGIGLFYYSFALFRNIELNKTTSNLVISKHTIVSTSLVCAMIGSAIFSSYLITHASVCMLAKQYIYYQLLRYGFVTDFTNADDWKETYFGVDRVLLNLSNVLLCGSVVTLAVLANAATSLVGPMISAALQTWTLISFTAVCLNMEARLITVNRTVESAKNKVSIISARREAGAAQQAGPPMRRLLNNLSSITQFTREEERQLAKEKKAAKKGNKVVPAAKPHARFDKDWAIAKFYGILQDFQGPQGTRLVDEDFATSSEEFQEFTDLYLRPTLLAAHSLANIDRREYLRKIFMITPEILNAENPFMALFNQSQTLLIDLEVRGFFKKANGKRMYLAFKRRDIRIQYARAAPKLNDTERMNLFLQLLTDSLEHYIDWHGDAVVDEQSLYSHIKRMGAMSMVSNTWYDLFPSDPALQGSTAMDWENLPQGAEAAWRVQDLVWKMKAFLESERHFLTEGRFRRLVITKENFETFYKLMQVHEVELDPQGKWGLKHPGKEDPYRAFRWKMRRQQWPLLRFWGGLISSHEYALTFLLEDVLGQAEDQAFATMINRLRISTSWIIALILLASLASVIQRVRAYAVGHPESGGNPSF